MKTILAAALVLSATVAASAQWRLDDGVAIVEPSPEGNTSNMELVALSCGEPVLLEVYARGGPVTPDGQDIEVDYFYKPDKVQAAVDGKLFKLAAAGSGGAVVLFGQGGKAQNYLADVPKALIDAMKGGTRFTLAFDVTPANNPDGTAFETVANFPLAGSREAIEKALEGCSG